MASMMVVPCSCLAWGLKPLLVDFVRDCRMMNLLNFKDDIAFGSENIHHWLRWWSSSMTPSWASCALSGSGRVLAFSPTSGAQRSQDAAS